MARDYTGDVAGLEEMLRRLREREAAATVEPVPMPPPINGAPSPVVPRKAGGIEIADEERARFRESINYKPPSTIESLGAAIKGTIKDPIGYGGAGLKEFAKGATDAATFGLANKALDAAPDYEGSWGASLGSAFGDMALFAATGGVLGAGLKAVGLANRAGKIGQAAKFLSGTAAKSGLTGAAIGGTREALSDDEDKSIMGHAALGGALGVGGELLSRAAMKGLGKLRPSRPPGASAAAGAAPESPPSPPGDLGYTPDELLEMHKLGIDYTKFSPSNPPKSNWPSPVQRRSPMGPDAYADTADDIWANARLGFNPKETTLPPITKNAVADDVVRSMTTGTSQREVDAAWAAFKNRKDKIGKITKGKHYEADLEERVQMGGAQALGSTSVPDEWVTVAAGSADDAAPMSFQTAKGSVYELHPDGTTIRNKAPRPEHPGDSGVQPRSEKTWFVTPDDATKLGEIQANGPKRRLYQMQDGRVGIFYEEGPSAGKIEARTVVKPHAEPAVGLVPVEVWDGGRSVHFGNRITGVGGGGGRGGTPPPPGGRPGGPAGPAGPGGTPPPGGGGPGVTPPVEEPPAAPSQRGWLNTLAGGIWDKIQVPFKMLSRGNDPNGIALRNKVFDAADELNLLSQSFSAKFKKALEGLTPEQEEFLKGALVAHQRTSPEALSDHIIRSRPADATHLLGAQQRIRTVSDELWDNLVGLNLVDPSLYVPNYIPTLRTRVTTPGRVRVEVGGDFVPVNNRIRVGSQLLRERNENLPLSERMNELSLRELLNLQANATARVIALEKHLIRGGLGEGGWAASPEGRLVPWIETTLNNIRDDRLRHAASRLTQDIVYGGQRRSGMVADLVGEERWADVAKNLRLIEFNHMIAGSIMAPIVNLTQNMITFAKVPTTVWGRAWHDIMRNVEVPNTSHLMANLQRQFPDAMPGGIRNLHASEFADYVLGASGQYLKGDVDELVASKLLGSRTLKSIADVAGAPFRGSEKLMQRQTAYAGYLERIREAPDDLNGAIEAGKYLNRYINQFGGLANTPEAFRTPGGSLIGQFKSFQVGLGGIVADLTKDFGKGFVMAGNPETFREGLRLMSPLAKYVVGITALGGAKSIIGTVEPGEENTELGRTKLQLHEWFTRLPEPMQWSVAGQIGADFSSQVGLGALPMFNIQDLTWFMPGPFVSHAFGIARLTGYLMDRGGFNLAGSGNLAEQAGWPKMGPDEAASLITRDVLGGGVLPGGPQMDRIRKYLNVLSNQGDERISKSVAEGMGPFAQAASLGLLGVMGVEVPKPTGELIRNSWQQQGLDVGALHQPLSLDNAWTHVNTLPMAFYTTEQRSEDIEKRARLSEEGFQAKQAVSTYTGYLAAGRPEDAENFKAQWERKWGQPLKITKAALEGAFKRQILDAETRLRERVPDETARHYLSTPRPYERDR